MFVSFAGIASVQVETVGRNESCYLYLHENDTIFAKRGYTG